MMSYIKITLDSPEAFLKAMFQSSLEAQSAIVIMDNIQDADIKISVTEKNFILSAQQDTTSLPLPCKLEHLIKDIKNLYYKIHCEDFSLSFFCTISNHYLIKGEITVELSKLEEMTLKLLTKAGDTGVEKTYLYDILGTGAESVIYRLRKKLTPFSVSLVLEKDYFKLKDLPT